ncbi:hypothetical protein CY652_00200 [Burkholderia sp. WAC0059]|uniref:hypothetical protein n=1 Tax=Burkholderia sp. WAC0059 TaxID=2066022 RepID=UPI000C7EF4AF|nr:hypothetical protein [Burkholderia sp. WAC0059]PLZ04148.1 hypothetical protein CY652_00200 [Burkholderia sp. WAC0059]
MNLQEQIGALETRVDQLIRTAAAPASGATTATPDTERETQKEKAPAAPPAGHTDEVPVLQIGRPSQNEITMTIGGQSVSLQPQQISQLIEELSNARASMTPEPPASLPAGWRFASTRNPVMAVQKQSNGDRLLVMRHTGHGWVPFVLSPDMVAQLYMMLTQR